MRRRRIISLKLRRRVTKNLRVFLLYCRTLKKQLPKTLKSISIFSKKTWTKRFAISALIVTIIASSFTFFKHPTLVLGQTYNITQNDWSGGATAPISVPVTFDEGPWNNFGEPGTPPSVDVTTSRASFLLLAALTQHDSAVVPVETTVTGGGLSWKRLFGGDYSPTLSNGSMKAEYWGAYSSGPLNAATISLSSSVDSWNSFSIVSLLNVNTENPVGSTIPANRIDGNLVANFSGTTNGSMLFAACASPGGGSSLAAPSNGATTVVYTPWTDSVHIRSTSSVNGGSQTISTTNWNPGDISYGVGVEILAVTDSAAVVAPDNLSGWNKYAAKNSLMVGNGSTALMSSSGSVSESFGTTANRDVTNTTVVWSGSGEITNPVYAPTDIMAKAVAAGMNITTFDFTGSVTDPENHAAYIVIEGILYKYDFITDTFTDITVSSGLAAYEAIHGTDIYSIELGAGKLYIAVNCWSVATIDTATGLLSDEPVLGSGRGCNRVVPDIEHNKIYFPAGRGSLIYHDLVTHTTTDVSESSGLTSIVPSDDYANAVAIDQTDGKIYLSGGRYFVVYDPATGLATDLETSSGLHALWPERYWNGMKYNPNDHKIYLYGSGAATGTMFAVYNPATGLVTDLTAGANFNNIWITDVVFSSDNKAFVSGYSGLKVYDVASGIWADVSRGNNDAGIARLAIDNASSSFIAYGQWVDWTQGGIGIPIINYYRIPCDTCTATSKTLDTTVQNIASATLTKNDTPGTGTATYQLSNNGGTNWETVTPGSLHSFSTTGSDLRFKISLTGNASVQDISIAYNFYSAAGELFSSKFDAVDPTNIVNKISWDENSSLPSGTRTVVSARTAGTANGLNYVPWTNFSNGQPASTPSNVSESFSSTTNRDANQTTGSWTGLGLVESGSYSNTSLSSSIPSGFSGLMSFGIDTANRAIYFGDGSGHLGKYDLVSGTATDITASSGLSSFWGNDEFSGWSNMVEDSGKIFMIGANYHFASLDTATGQVTDLSAVYQGAVWPQHPSRLAVDNVNHKVYISGPRLVVYDVPSGTASNVHVSSGLSTIMTQGVSSMTADSATGNLYVGGGAGGGQLAVYNQGTGLVTNLTVSSGLSSFWGTSQVMSMVFNPSNNNLYLGSNDSKFAVYNPTTGLATNLSVSSGLSAMYPSSWMASLSSDGGDNIVLTGVQFVAAYHISTNSIDELNANYSNHYVSIYDSVGKAFYYGVGSFNQLIVPCASCAAVSTTLDTVTQNILSAKLTKNDTPGTGTVSYQLSNNGGTNWETVTPGSLHVFSSTGSDLRFKITFTGNATVQDVSIEYYSAVPGSTNCTKSGTTVTCGISTVPASFQDGSGDRFFQYKITLVSDGTNTPTITSAAIQFVVNAAPEVRNVTAVQNANGTVTISYETRDIDTAGGTPGNVDHIHPSFEYWNGTAYQTITALAAGDTDPVAVPHDGSWNNVVHTATWTPSTDYPGHYQNNTARIRVTANDNEGANPTGSAESTLYSLDTKIPATASLTIDASASTPTAHLAATDDNAMTMKVSITDPTLAATSSEPFATTKTISSLAEGNTVYARVTDAFNNSTSIMSAPVPVTPTAVIIQDISNVVATPNTFRLFLAWKATTGAFASYRVHRSATNSAPETWAEVASIGTQSTNYYVDNDINEGDSLYYYVTAVDSAGNISFRSSIVHATANGTQDAGEGGGGTAVAPVITTVSSGTPRSTQATITWATDVLSDSVVEYSTSPSTFTSSAAIDSLVDNASGVGIHSVILSGLAPETQYYFRVSSTDINGRATTDANGGTGYTFTTAVGPTISAVTISNIKNTTAHIAWTTNTSSSTEVRYSTNYTLSGPTSVVSEDPNSTTHAMDITGLNPGTVYYFEVRSVDGASNETIDNNVIDGTIHYYTFTTANDLTAPVIGGVTTTLVSDTSAVITWGTDEPSTSQVLYGATTAYGSQTAENPILTITHSVTITGLTASTSYVYEVRSADTYGNIATNDNTGTGYSFTTAAAPGTPSASRRPEVDRTPPIIMNVRVGSIGKHSVRIEWTTDEAADTIVKYGKTVAYGSLAGSVDEKISSHQVDITDLTVGTVYHFIAVSSDGNGNQASTTDRVFATLNEDGTIIPVPAQPEETTPPTVTPPATEEPKVEEPKKPKVMDLFQALLSDPDLSTVPEDYLTTTVNEIIERVVRIPSIVGPAPKVEVDGTIVTIRWTTDKKTSGMVYFVKDEDFKKNEMNPYSMSATDFNENVTTHAVTIEDLTPATTYHFQVRSKGLIGGEARSADATFVTASELPQITDLSISKVSDLSAVLTWKTNIPTKTDIEYKNLVSGTALTQGDPALLRDHKFTLDKLESGAPYTVVITATDENGGKTQSKAINLSTSKDGEGPIISRIKSESTLYPGKESRVQTIVSWTTDEPSTSLVYYQEGLSGDAATTEMPIDSVLTTSHTVVITKFRPATVYKIRVESTDSSGNVTKSNDVMVLTPQQKASVLDMIIKNFEQVFGWTKKLQ